MSAVLGISAEYHDAAAALVIDGRIVAAMQEERFSRKKNDASLPLQAAAACLRMGGIPAAGLDAVVFYENPYAKLERVMLGSLAAYPRGVTGFPRALASQLGRKLWVLDALAEQLGVPRSRVDYVDHHRAHAASTFYTSPYERAAVLVVDGVGESTSTSVWLGEGRQLRELGSIPYPHSLGLLYAAVTAWLGFEVNEGEYKVMGLAAFGTPRYATELGKLLRLEAHGAYRLDLDYLTVAGESELGFSSELERLLGPRRSPYRSWDLQHDEDRRYADVACSLQVALEEALLHLARHALRRSGADSLCLAGGVALNAVANARLLAESGFDRVFVTPAAGDAGGALGAALLRALELGDARPPALRSAALGLPVDTGEAMQLAHALGLRARRTDPVADAIAALDAGSTVAFCQGRFEWGPRALGQRSLLAPAHDAATKERLNRVVKRREPFRPFAPVVLAERAATMFVGAPNDMTPFMTTVCQVAESQRAALTAAMHVDGSARVQTVDAEGPAELRAVLQGMARPALLNTSLNGRGEPICASAADALGFCLEHPVDLLLIGDVRIEKPT